MAFVKKFGNKKPFNKDRFERSSSRPSSRSSPRAYGERARPSYGDRQGFDRKPGRLELFDAVCESCGKDCQLPFKPTGEKPVYCRDCFNQDDRNAKNDSRRDDRKRSPRSDDLSEINRKLDKIMRALKIE